ncbi:hypothetical protein [Streptomyces longhuiensis]|uniref:hypothetical protein n=1 Tax=Streptomyces longhuiensis TaxID=2880933 RepID=UPI001D09BA0E|nr:hypothetical protein [Streptomyces longhuiensis]UDM05460.1 hypothetical protein LGI35_45215 [Streptomyces longhuiensis]
MAKLPQGSDSRMICVFRGLMHAIACGTCATEPRLLRVLSNGIFECPDGHQLAPQEIDLDGSHVWAVIASGILGCVVDPARAVEALGEAVDDVGSGGKCPDPAYAVRAAFCGGFDAFADVVGVCRAGVA